MSPSSIAHMILTSDRALPPPTKLAYVCRWPDCGYRFLTPGELKRHCREARHYGALPPGMVMGQGIGQGKAKGPARAVFLWTEELVARALGRLQAEASYAMIAEEFSALGLGPITKLAVKAKLARARRAKAGLRPRADVRGPGRG